MSDSLLSADAKLFFALFEISSSIIEWNTSQKDEKKRKPVSLCPLRGAIGCSLPLLMTESVLNCRMCVGLHLPCRGRKLKLYTQIHDFERTAQNMELPKRWKKRERKRDREVERWKRGQLIICLNSKAQSQPPAIMKGPQKNKISQMSRSASPPSQQFSEDLMTVPSW